MPLLPSLHGGISRARYAIAAAALLLSQHLAVALVFVWAQAKLLPGFEFWLLPLRRLSALPDLPIWGAMLGFAFTLAVSWGLAALSFRRASSVGQGYTLAALAIVPGLQIGAVLALAVLPVRPSPRAAAPDGAIHIPYVLQGLLAGVAIVVLAVVISAVLLGAYGWGLFVMTPFMVGVCTAYLANRNTPLPPGRTQALVMAAAGLGTLGLLMLALEGVACIVLAAPLGALAAAMGGVLGRWMALTAQPGSKPLRSLSVLPAVFAFEAALPPALPIATEERIEIAAPPAAVWRELTSSNPIASPPGLTGRAGLAYPVGGRLLGEGVGAERHGAFSTGTAVERITEWERERRLAFVVLSQPPAMAEISLYRHVHSPHVAGYFTTVDTSFTLDPLPGGGTRLTARASHVLRIDPVLYWEPLARWAICANVTRVLLDLKARAEAG